MSLEAHYRTLNLKPGASLQDIKKAYRKLALKFHPDRNPNIANPEEAFSKINQAYKVLSEYAQSSEYHEIHDQEHTHPGWNEAPFDEDTHPGGTRKRKTKTHYRYSLLLTLEECALGCSKVIHFFKSSPLGGKEEVRLEVAVPSGVKEGQKLKLRDEGPVLEDGTRGDLFVYVDVLPHPLFERKGRNVYMDLPISLNVALMGGKVSIPTLSGQASLTIPANTHTGKVFRLKQKGFSHIGMKGKGDMLVKMIIDFPENLTNEELAALEILQRRTPPLVKEYNAKLQETLINRKR